MITTQEDRANMKLGTKFKIVSRDKSEGLDGDKFSVGESAIKFSCTKSRRQQRSNLKAPLK